MYKLIDEKTERDLNGRLLFTSEFVDPKDIEGKIVLEIGCGYGWFLAKLIILEASKIFGIDTDIENIKVCKNDQEINQNVILNVGSALNLPYDDNTFNSIFAWEVLEHIPSKSEDIFFQELNRVLKNDGVIYLSTPNRSIISNLMDPAWFLIGHRHYSIADLRRFANTANLIEELIVLKGGFYEAFFTLNLYISKWIFRRKPFFQKYLHLLDSEWKKDHGFTNIFIKLRK